MTRDQELWGVAAEVLNQHGENAPMFVAETIGALALAGETEGLATWQGIAHRLDQLRRPPEVAQ